MFMPIFAAEQASYYTPSQFAASPAPFVASTPPTTSTEEFSPEDEKTIIDLYAESEVSLSDDQKYFSVSVNLNNDKNEKKYTGKNIKIRASGDDINTDDLLSTNDEQTNIFLHDMEHAKDKDKIVIASIVSAKGRNTINVLFDYADETKSQSMKSELSAKSQTETQDTNQNLNNQVTETNYEPQQEYVEQNQVTETNYEPQQEYVEENQVTETNYDPQQQYVEQNQVTETNYEPQQQYTEENSNVYYENSGETNSETQ